MTGDVDSKGFYICDKHCIVTLLLDGIAGVELAHFNLKNALSQLEFGRENDEFVLIFNPSHGMEGTIKAKTVSIEITPGIPTDSQYKRIGT